jgi:WD40 repeat protein
MAPPEEFTLITYSADGQTLWGGSAQGRVYSWDLKDHQTYRLISHGPGTLVALVFSSAGPHFAAAYSGGIIEWREYPSGQLKATWNSGNAEVNFLAISPDGKVLAAGTNEKTVLLFDMNSGQLRQTLRQHAGAVNALAFSSDGKRLASGADDRMVVLWDLATGRPIQIFKNHVQTVTSVAFSPDGFLLACGHGNKSVALWNIENKKLERILTLPELIPVRN